MADIYIALCVFSILLLLVFSPVAIVFRIDGGLTLDINFIYFAIRLTKRKDGRKDGSKKKESSKDRTGRPSAGLILERLITRSRVSVDRLALPCPDGNIAFAGIFNSAISAFIAYINSKAKKLTLSSEEVGVIPIDGKMRISVTFRCTLIEGIIALWPLLLHLVKNKGEG